MKRSGLLFWLIAVSLPFFLGFLNIQLLVSQSFLRLEYNKTNFPADPYGFTRDQRLELAPPAIEFLASWERPESAIRLLEEQTLDGEPLYNERELDHMVDTKRRTDIIRIMTYITGAVILGGAIYFSIQGNKEKNRIWQALYSGAVITTCLLGAISLYILLGWDSFFTRFHELLFPPGTWTFFYSDTLIRLFPEKLWFDVGVLLGVGTLVEAIVIGLLAYFLAKRTTA